METALKVHLVSPSYIAFDHLIIAILNYTRVKLKGELLNTRDPFRLVVTELGICHSSTLTKALMLPSDLIPKSCGECATIIEYSDETIELNRIL